MKIAIVILATNAYLPLGIRFIKKFLHYYNGNAIIKFYLFCNTDPAQYLSAKELDSVVYKEQNHSCWVDGTNSKYKNIIGLEKDELDYIFYFDADTNIYKQFDESWFIGDLVVGEHFSNKSDSMKNKPFDKNPKSKAYVDPNSQLPRMYYYGAFFGGKKDLIIQFCQTMMDWQAYDKNMRYEPVWNDESYLNSYFHYNPPPKVVTNENFMFAVSDKGGIGETRNMKLDISKILESMKQNKEAIYDIANGSLRLINC